MKFEEYWDNLAKRNRWDGDETTKAECTLRGLKALTRQAFERGAEEGYSRGRRAGDLYEKLMGGGR